MTDQFVVLGTVAAAKAADFGKGKVATPGLWLLAREAIGARTLTVTVTKYAFEAAVAELEQFHSDAPAIMSVRQQLMNSATS